MGLGKRLRNEFINFLFLLVRPKTLGVRAIAFDGEGRVLLVKHTYVRGWHLPGGGVDRGESVYEALHKELREEANAAFDGTPELMSVHLNQGMSKRDHVVVFRCDDVVQTQPKERDLEIAAAAFFALDQLPEDTTKSTLRRIRECQGLEPADHYW
ncbi:NUDIX domain-containing protein [Oricola sp.]|uniref:NUDIX domain-containing protein n=1 Tax=Oricola sp. TaxID=1979950 RepID=UPI003BAD5002